MIIVSITGPTMKDAIRQIDASERYADIIELRFDAIERPNIIRLVEYPHKPVIATCRSRGEGGRFAGSSRELMEVLDMASVFGASWVDIELGADPAILRAFLARKREVKVIVSQHLKAGTTVNVRRSYAQLVASGADVIKFAYVATDAAEIRHARDFLARASREKRRAVAIAMGEAGEASRVLYNVWGGWGTYAAAETGPVAAPGQLRAAVLRDLYKTGALRRTTRVFGVIGHPLGQSKGPLIHNPLFARAGRNAVYCRFPTRDLSAFMKHIAPDLSGISVTIPHKQAIMKYLSGMDATAKAIGAVNTVVRRGRALYGTNTDAPGALDAIEDLLSVEGNAFLVVGTGGAARAIAYEAARRGADVMITGRSPGKGRRLARELGVRWIPPGAVRRIAPRVIANATSVGMVPHPNKTPLRRSFLRAAVVFDAVYNPPVTRLLREAKSMGARTVSGIEMYLNQAALQSALYAGAPPDRRRMRKLLAAAGATA